MNLAKIDLHSDIETSFAHFIDRCISGSRRERASRDQNCLGAPIGKWSISDETRVNARKSLSSSGKPTSNLSDDNSMAPSSRVLKFAYMPSASKPFFGFVGLLEARSHLKNRF
ncbi:hypothetical protein [Methylomonas rhizoryzae]|uniref:hypothetical protein n=1 Tax=Methylomonas rhizoryzae TaxID=2608981 RepID=UPI0016809F1C|nr:hypothetical protein [Methylomonas rhizoryzae]